MKVLVMIPEQNGHPDEELLERYVMETISDEEASQLEEHLFTCTDCRRRLSGTETFIAAMKAAAGRIRSGARIEKQAGRRLKWNSSS